MSLELWLAFVAASFLVALLPEPSLLIFIADAISTSQRASVITALGVVAADAVILTSSLLGAGAVLATSAMAFSVMKWIGVAYLLYLEAKQLLASHSSFALKSAKTQSAKHLFAKGFL